MKALLIDRSGSHPKMTLGDSLTPKPGENELLVKIKATALNRADLLQKAGHYPPPESASPILGLEMSGIVTATGDRVTRFQKGERVFGLLSGGGYAEYCVIHEGHALKIPDKLGFEEAAAIPEAFLTAFQALNLLGNIKQGEKVVIHAGTSGVGTAAIQLAKQLYHARVAATAGKPEKCSCCLKLGAELSVDYKRHDFEEVIRKSWGPSSADLIIDVVGRPYWEKNMELLAVDGRLVLLAMLGGSRAGETNLATILRKRLTIRGSTLRNRSDSYKTDLVEQFRSASMEKIRQGSLRPVIHTILDWQMVESAHRMMENNENIGKIVMTGM